MSTCEVLGSSYDCCSDTASADSDHLWPNHTPLHLHSRDMRGRDDGDDAQDPANERAVMITITHQGIAHAREHPCTLHMEISAYGMAGTEASNLD